MNTTNTQNGYSEVIWMKINRRGNIEAERRRQGLTQTEIAKLLGTTPPTYRTWINGGNIPSSKLIIMADLFDCSTDYLLGRDNPDDVA